MWTWPAGLVPEPNLELASTRPLLMLLVGLSEFDAMDLLVDFKAGKLLPYGTPGL